MAVTKTWDVVAMDSAPTEGSLSDVVKTVHWNCTGTETVGSDTYTSYSYGSVGLGDADSSSFTAFAFPPGVLKTTIPFSVATSIGM